MSEFGFEAYSLDGAELAAEAHPLEIARDLIARGKPRSALDLLSAHHDALADDPEYLFVCAEAWWADGESLRAQQALLGAARLSPNDPTPLQALAALYRELGEEEKALRLIAKADTLETASGRESLQMSPAEVEDDLIAFAERHERSAQAGFTPKQILVALVALVGIGGLVAGIAVLTDAGDESSALAASESGEPGTEVVAVPEVPTTPEVPSEPAPRTTEQDAAPVESAAAEPAPVAAAEPLAEAAPEPEVAPRPPAAEKPAAKATATPRPKRVAPPARPRAKAPKKVVPASATPKSVEPDPATVEAELASMGPPALTARADALHAQGHTSAAASYYRRALEQDPDYAPALVGIGRGILRAEKYDDAMANATRALQHARGVDARPGLEAEAIYQMARVHLHQGNLDAARRLFRQAISLPGAPAAAWFYLGEALWSENSPAARAAYERYLELVPKGHLADRARRAIQ